jgi:hypothetical protein
MMDKARLKQVLQKNRNTRARARWNHLDAI